MNLRAPILSSLLLLGCSQGDAVAGPKAQVVVELSSVTLGDDCGPEWSPPAPKSPAKPGSPPVPGRAPASRVAGDCAGDCGERYACQQTSVQFSVRSPPGAPLTTVRVKRVEFLDDKGKLLGELKARESTRWSSAGAYEPWDGTIRAGESAEVSAILSSPNWGALEGGQWGQHGKTFQVRITVVVGDKDRVIERQAIQPAFRPPPVPT